MSTRNIRKLAQKLQPQPVEQVEETQEAVEVFEPLYTGNLAAAYEELAISSSSDPEDGVEITKSTDDETPPAVSQRKKKKNNRKRRNRNKNRLAVNQDSSLLFQQDEVDKVLAEVNELLGVPEAPEPEPATVTQASMSLLKIDYKHLNVHNELKRMFGPDENDILRGKRRINSRLRRRQIVFTNESYSFTARGLSMSLLEIKNDVKYFKFEHGPEYQKNMHTLVKAMKIHYDQYIRAQDYDIYPTNTVEALIQNLDLYFLLDENNIATNALEQALYFMQSVFDPSFNYLDGKTRLEYRHVENRAFHVALLKYLHILTNKACHRTALELAKLMLNLDPTDPLGVIFIIDTLALRAREHQWLVDIYAHWSVEIEADRLFNLRYSHALAVHHLYLKNKKPEDLQTSNDLIKHALVTYPKVAVMIMSLCKHENPEIMEHEMFTRLANSTTSTDVKNLQLLYAKFVWPKWREANIMSWVTANALEVIARYKDDTAIKQGVQKGIEVRSRLLRRFPIEIKRYLSTISSMSNLLVEGAVPRVKKTIAFNPYPNLGRSVDVHRYFKGWGVESGAEITPAQRGIIRSFIESLVPNVSGNDEA